MHLWDLDRLDRRRTWWVPAVAPAPEGRGRPDLVVAPGSLRAGRDEFATFDSELACLRWILRHRARLNRTLPGARIRAIPLERWLSGRG